MHFISSIVFIEIQGKKKTCKVVSIFKIELTRVPFNMPQVSRFRFVLAATVCRKRGIRSAGITTCLLPSNESDTEMR